MQQAVDSLTGWYSCWPFSINERKTLAIVFSKGPEEPREILIGTEEIPWQRLVIYLGITLDKRLHMLQHIRRTSGIAGNHRHPLAPILGNQHLPPCRLHLFSAFLRPIIAYVAPAWCSLMGAAARCILNTTDWKSLRTTLRLGWKPGNAALWEIANMPPLDDVLRERTIRFERGAAS
ncbi:uncharacterized protein [Hetaerina americana]|uniref:uncharacterized protein n=1 Tax=Hetaerina americana TaxID=62018 RepID=UPI003A7F3A3C